MLERPQQGASVPKWSVSEDGDEPAFSHDERVADGPGRPRLPDREQESNGGSERGEVVGRTAALSRERAGRLDVPVSDMRVVHGGHAPGCRCPPGEQRREGDPASGYL